MTRQFDRHLLSTFIAATLVFALCGSTTADEAFAIAARELRPAHHYEYEGGPFTAYLATHDGRLQLDDLITLDVGVECPATAVGMSLGNPYLEPDLPTLLVVCVFDSDGKFVGSIPKFDEPEAEREKLERLSSTLVTDLKTGEVAGTSVSLSTGPVSAVCGNRLTLLLEKPGIYTVQAVCAKRMFDIPPEGNLSAKLRFEWLLRQRTQKKFIGVACRSAPITVVVGESVEKERFSQPFRCDSEAPTACRLTQIGTTDNGEAVVMLRHTNTSLTDLYLHEPVMRITGDITSPVRMWLETSESRPLLDLSNALAAWQYGGRHPIVRLPPGAFVAKRHMIPNTWNHLDRKLEAAYSEDLFTTRAYAEYRRDGKRTPPGVSKEDYYKTLIKDLPRHEVRSNYLELPAVSPDRN